MEQALTPPRAGAVIPVFLWIAAFLCALYPINDWQLEFFGGCVLILLFWSWLSLARKGDVGWDVPRGAVGICAGFFWLLVLLSLFWSVSKADSVMGFGFFSVMPLTFFTAIMATDRRFFKIAGAVLAAILSVMAVWAVLQFFFLNTYFLGQARHPLADPASLGALFSLGFFAGAGWMFAASGKKERYLATALCAILLCGILSTVARGPIFALVPGLVMMGILLWPQVKRHWRGLLAILLCGAAYFALMQSGGAKKYDLTQRIVETVSHTPGNPDGTSNRITVWKTTWEMIKEHPWLGSGAGTYYLRYSNHRMESDPDGAFLAHNDPLQFWVEYGILGPILFYAFAVAASVRTFRSLRRAKGIADAETNRQKIVVAAIFCAMVAMVAHSHVSFNHYNLSILMLSGLMLAAWYRAGGALLSEIPKTIVLPQEHGGVAKILLLLPYVMTGWLFASVIAGEHFANRARDDLFTERMFEFAENVNRADRVSQGLNYRSFLLAVNVPMAILQVEKEGGKTNIESQKKLYAQVEGYMRTVMALNPSEPAPYFYLAKVQGLVAKEVVPDGTPSPEEYYKKALALDPAYLQARLALADLYGTEGRTGRDILAVLEPGADFNYATLLAENYYGRLVQLYLEQRNYVKMKEVIKKLADFKKLDLYSRQKQASSIPQALTGGDKDMVQP